jgi:hypothetical protein
VYYYTPESKGDNNLVTPLNNGGQIADISHISVCFDYELEISKTAETSFERLHKWSIDKKLQDSQQEYLTTNV